MIEPVDPFPATPPESGLIPSCRKLDRVVEGDGRWAMGYGYVPEAQGPGAYARSMFNADNIGSDTYKASEVDPTQNTEVHGYPIILTAEESCGFSGVMHQDEYEGRARRRLEAMGSKILEWEFWTGEVAQLDALSPDEFHWLANANAVDLTPAAGAQTPRMALSILEEALGDVGTGAGMIHCTRRMAMLMPDRWSEGLLYSQLDSSIVLGSGYPGTGPTGADPAAGEQWVYATNVVVVRLGEIQLWPTEAAQAVDQRKNTLAYKAERVGSATWDGNCHFAIRVALS
jgi:hypothetical protein